MERVVRHNRHGRLMGAHLAGSRAIKTWVCSNPKCEIKHRPKDGVCVCMDARCPAGQGKKPAQCHCGWMAFDLFDSSSEADWWLILRRRERIGVITKLRRQVAYRLMASDLEDRPVDSGRLYIADFVWVVDGVQHRADVKPRAGTDDLADLKLAWMAAMGLPVEILT